ncbi:hypothetical protein Ancab_038177 [Ancistrocladus abbreviatus]
MESVAHPCWQRPWEGFLWAAPLFFLAMTRSAVKLQLIANEAARKASYQKRKAGLLKKLKELHILCGVDMCAFIFSEYDVEPEVWLSLKDACQVIDRFNDNTSAKRNVGALDREAFLMKSIQKLEEKLKLQEIKNQKLRMLILGNQFLAGQIPTLPDTVGELNVLVGDLVLII